MLCHIEKRFCFIAAPFCSNPFSYARDKSPGYDQKTQMRHIESTGRQRQGVKQSANHYSREGVTIASEPVVQFACVVQLLFINGLKASVKLTTSSPDCLSSLLLTGL